jgi:hypothetical protein
MTSNGKLLKGRQLLEEDKDLDLMLVETCSVSLEVFTRKDGKHNKDKIEFMIDQYEKRSMFISETGNSGFLFR